MSIGERAFRWLLYAYPAEFRRRYRDELIAFFRADRARGKYGGGLVGSGRWWVKTLTDLARTAATERIARFGRLAGWGPAGRGSRGSKRQPREPQRMSTLLQDIRYASRTLARSPGFTIIAIATLGLGIGTNAAMFSIVNGVLLDDLPYGDVDRIAMVWGSSTDGEFGVSENERLRYREQTEIFAEFGTFRFFWASLSGPDGVSRVSAAAIDEAVLPALDVMPPLGRNFVLDETQPGNAGVVILSHALWQQRFNADPTVIGRGFPIDGRDVTIVGIAPEDFHLPGDFVGQPVQLYVPDIFADPDPQNIHYMRGIGRLRDGVSLEQALAHMEPLGERLKAELPTLPPSFTPATVPMRDVVLGEVRPVLLILLGSVGLVLLIACVNVANLFLARSEGRSAEMAVRVALGAGRGRLVRQLLTESGLLAIAGGGLGLVVASMATTAVVRLDPPNVPRIDQLGMSFTVIAFTIGISALTALLFGVVPALMASNTNLRGALHEGGRGATDTSGRLTLRRTLVVAEVTLAMMLAIGAGLLVRSFANLQAVESGLNPTRVLTMQITLPPARYRDATSARAFYRELLTLVRGLPGVVRAGAISDLPLASEPGDWGIRIEGREEERLPSGRRPWADRMIASDDYFEAMGIPVVEGRGLGLGDSPGTQQVVVINQTAARRYWPGESAIGKRFKLSADIDTVYRTIVGVTNDVKHRGLSSEINPEMYLPHNQHSATQNFAVRTMNLVIQAGNEPLSLVGAVRSAAGGIDAEVPISSIRTMHDVLSASTSTARLNVALFGVFGVLGLLLVSVGVYGVMSYFISQRTKELGIRIALGAAPQSVLTLVVGHGLTLAVLGAALGVAGALGMGRLLSSLLFGVTWHDPLTFLTVPAIVTSVALLACVIPAVRATRVDPIQVLRSE